MARQLIIILISDINILYIFGVPDPPHDTFLA